MLVASSRGLHARQTGSGIRGDLKYEPRGALDTSGFTSVVEVLPQWQPAATLRDISTVWRETPGRQLTAIDDDLSKSELPQTDRVMLLITKALLLNYQNEPARAYEVVREARSMIEKDDELAEKALYTLIYLQGVCGLRLGETDNCVMCRGESSCILPISAKAVHTDATGSRMAIAHFTEYLKKFPGDQDVRWLLNVAHMTLGEYPNKVDSRYRVSIEPFLKSEFDIGRFRDIGDRAKVNRFNMAGGAVMEDFDNDGLLDLATTSFDPTMPMAYYRNEGDGTFKEKTQTAGLLEQLGGKKLVQTDFNNDGRMDLFISRGAWLQLSDPSEPVAE